jgi:hypothetical protein
MEKKVKKTTKAPIADETPKAEERKEEAVSKVNPAFDPDIPEQKQRWLR